MRSTHLTDDIALPIGGEAETTVQTVIQTTATVEPDGRLRLSEAAARVLGYQPGDRVALSIPKQIFAFDTVEASSNTEAAFAAARAAWRGVAHLLARRRFGKVCVTTPLIDT